MRPTTRSWTLTLNWPFPSYLLGLNSSSWLMKIPCLRWITIKAYPFASSSLLSIQMSTNWDSWESKILTSPFPNWGNKASKSKSKGRTERSTINSIWTPTMAPTMKWKSKRTCLKTARWSKPTSRSCYMARIWLKSASLTTNSQVKKSTKNPRVEVQIQMKASSQSKKICRFCSRSWYKSS